MDLTIHLTPDEAQIVSAARARGIDVEKLLHSVLEQLSEPPSSGQDNYKPGERTAALLRQWREEDATDDEEELVRRDRDNSEFMENLRSNRVNFPVPEV